MTPCRPRTPWTCTWPGPCCTHLISAQTRHRWTPSCPPWLCPGVWGCTPSCPRSLWTPGWPRRSPGQCTGSWSSPPAGPARRGSTGREGTSRLIVSLFVRLSWHRQEGKILVGCSLIDLRHCCKYVLYIWGIFGVSVWTDALRSLSEKKTCQQTWNTTHTFITFQLILLLSQRMYKWSFIPSQWTPSSPILCINVFPTVKLAFCRIMLPFNLKEDLGDKLSRYLARVNSGIFCLASSYNNHNYQTVTYFSSNILKVSKFTSRKSKVIFVNFKLSKEILTIIGFGLSNRISRGKL